MINLINHFRRDDRRHSEWLRQRQWLIKAQDDKERREQTADKFDDDFASLAIDVVIASEAQMKAFEVKLDTYETATVAALMENQQQLDVIHARIEAMLAQAYVMEDGRRVFKTEDGTQVFDEFGQEVSSEELDFDLISDSRPTWGSYQENTATRDALLAEKEELTEYLENIDEAKDRTASDPLSETEIEEMNAELLEAMPSRAREHAPDLEVTAKAPNLTASFKSPAALPSSAPTVSPSVPVLT